MSSRGVHETWMQNCQATAVCDLCNRRNIPLQKCQDCQINICKQCTTNGMLENDPQHKLARDAADKFDWHQQGKNKNTKRISSIEKTQSTTRVTVQGPEIPAWNTPSQPFNRYGESLPPSANLQYSPIHYGSLMPMMHSSRYGPALQIHWPVSLPPTLGQYQGGPPIHQYPYSLSPYAMYDAPAGQRVCNSYATQQPQHSFYSSQVPQLSFEFPGSATNLVPTLREGTTQSSQQFPVAAQLEDVSRPFQAPSRRPATQVTPNTPVLAQTLSNANRNETIQISRQPSTHFEDVQHREEASNRHSVTRAPTNVSKPLLPVFEASQKFRHDPDFSKRAIRGSKRPREVSENSAQDNSQEAGSAPRQLTKKSGRETSLWTAERRSCSRYTSRISKSSPRIPEDQNTPRSSYAKKRRRDDIPRTRVVKLRVRSTAGIKRLREIIGDSQIGGML